MSTNAPAPGGDVTVDVAVVGGGLAGLATAVHLARRGRRVLCLEPRGWPRPAVGESLEFSAPRLLAELGVEVDGTDEQGLYPKESVVVSDGAAAFDLWPPPSFGRPPIWCSRVTYHADRTRLDERIVRLAVEHGAEILSERVTRVEHDGKAIRQLVTDRGRRVRAGWFIDATGHTRRLFGRALGLDREVLGPDRAALWGRVDRPPDGHATRLHFLDGDAPDLAWAWEIPLNRRQVSLGTVMTADRLATLRASGRSPRGVFDDQLRRCPRLRRIVVEHPSFELHATVYTPYRHRRSVGPNWLLVGDASAMVDPLTSNGVTSALRHAELAARIADDEPHARGRRRQAWVYEQTAPATVTTLDRAIEGFVYRPEVRQRLGLRLAVNLYAATGVITNAVYARIGQTSLPRATGSALLLALSRLWIRVGSLLAARLPRWRLPRWRPTDRPVAPVDTAVPS